MLCSKFVFQKFLPPGVVFRPRVSSWGWKVGLAGNRLLPCSTLPRGVGSWNLARAKREKVIGKIKNVKQALFRSGALRKEQQESRFPGTAAPLRLSRCKCRSHHPPSGLARPRPTTRSAPRRGPKLEHTGLRLTRPQSPCVLHRCSNIGTLTPLSLCTIALQPDDSSRYQKPWPLVHKWTSNPGSTVYCGSTVCGVLGVLVPVASSSYRLPLFQLGHLA